MSAPTFIIHGEIDDVIPVSNGKSLAEISQKVSRLPKSSFPAHMTHNDFDFDYDILRPVKLFIEEAIKVNQEI